jgi:hypothetical protein
VGWPSPPGGPCAPPPPGVAYPIPSSAAPLSMSLSFSTARPPPLVSPRLRGFSPLSPVPCSAPLPLSPDALPAALLPSLSLRMHCRLLCSPPSLLLFQIYSRRRPLLDRADYGEEMAESSGIEQMSMRRWRNRGGVGTRIRRQGAALPLRQAGSAPTLKRRLSDD